MAQGRSMPWAPGLMTHSDEEFRARQSATPTAGKVRRTVGETRLPAGSARRFCARLLRSNSAPRLEFAGL